MIDAYSFGYGACVGAVVVMLMMMVITFIGVSDTEKRMRKEIRKAHARGFANGRKWRGREKVLIDIELESLKETVKELEELQESMTNGEGRRER